MFEVLGLIFALLWEVMQVFLVIWACLLLPVLFFAALAKFAFAVTKFSWGKALLDLKEVFGEMIAGRKR